MINYTQLKKLINELDREINNISIEASNDKTQPIDTNNNPNNNPNNNYNYNFPNYNYNNINNNIDNRNRTTKKKKDDEKEEGYHPIIFLIATSTLAFGATYLIATDDYRKINKKFTDLDEIMNKINDKTKNTVLENKHLRIKESYEKLKSKLINEKSIGFYSKLGLIGSGLISLTYFFPFGTIALIPGIIGLTGFGCYWLWNYLNLDEYNEILKMKNDLIYNIDEYKEEVELNQLQNSSPNNNQYNNQQNNQQYDWNVSYPSMSPTAPIFNIN